MRKLIPSSGRKIFLILAILVVLTFGMFSRVQVSAFYSCDACPLCLGDVYCVFISGMIGFFHEFNENLLIAHITAEFLAHQYWLIDMFFRDNLLRAMMMMTEQLNAVAMQQTMIIGTFFDAKQQLETQRLFQSMQVQAHKDYQPSQELCLIGTAARSLAPSEQITAVNKRILSDRQLARHMGRQHVAGAESRDLDKVTRWERFLNRYCDPQDNGWTEEESETGLQEVCKNRDRVHNRLVNMDVDYTRLIDTPRSLNVSFYKEPLSAPANASDPDANEQDILAMGNNLYGHNVLQRNTNPVYLKNPSAQSAYLDIRSVAARRSVAENTYNSIVSMKTYGSADEEDRVYVEDDPDAKPGTPAYLAAILVDLGMPEKEVFEVIGEKPSYYAQLEILAKKVYQNPDFYAALYDKPANVARKAAALEAIELMLDRAIYESQLRREMNLSVLLSTRLRKYYNETQNRLAPTSN